MWNRNFERKKKKILPLWFSYNYWISFLWFMHVFFSSNLLLISFSISIVSFFQRALKVILNSWTSFLYACLKLLFSACFEGNTKFLNLLSLCMFEGNSWTSFLYATEILHINNIQVKQYTLVYLACTSFCCWHVSRLNDRPSGKHIIIWVMTRWTKH